jgi:hypothetical protein
MDSFNITEIEKPFKVIPDNLDGFKNKVNDLYSLTEGEKKVLL